LNQERGQGYFYWGGGVLILHFNIKRERGAYSLVIVVMNVHINNISYEIEPIDNIFNGNLNHIAYNILCFA